MQNLKTCSRCSQELPFAAFSRRAASLDGHQPACKTCTGKQKQLDYWGDPVQNSRQRERSIKNRNARLQDPAYKRAFYLWGTTKRRTKIPPWVSITDFVPICREAVAKGPEFQLDHVIPLKGKLVSGLHVPANIRVVPKEVNWAKSNKY